MPSPAPDAYRHWQRAVSSPQHWVPPVLERTEIYHMPVKDLAPAGVPEDAENGIDAYTSSNWSGSAIVDPSNPFKTEEVIGEFIVPTAHQAFGSCTGNWDHSSQWVGIDGFVARSMDLLQAGTEVDAFCSGGTTTGLYFAWIEWVPNYPSRITNFGINPGDEIVVIVWSTSPTQAMAYFHDYSTQQSTSVPVATPAGTSLVGNSVEWIVERPCLSQCPTSHPILATLTNYIDVPWTYGVAWSSTTGTYTYMGKNPPTGTLYDITMLDDAGNPISRGAIFSPPPDYSSSLVYFHNFGSSCGNPSPVAPGLGSAC